MDNDLIMNPFKITWSRKQYKHLGYPESWDALDRIEYR